VPVTRTINKAQVNNPGLDSGSLPLSTPNIASEISNWIKCVRCEKVFTETDLPLLQGYIPLYLVTLGPDVCIIPHTLCFQLKRKGDKYFAKMNETIRKHLKNNLQVYSEEWGTRGFNPCIENKEGYPEKFKINENPDEREFHCRIIVDQLDNFIGDKLSNNKTDDAYRIVWQFIYGTEGRCC
jgi:hypothetical protein